MEVGIVIIFCNNEEQIGKYFFIEQINASEKIEFCLVDNDSKDRTLQLLQEIKDACPSQLSIVEIKKNISENSAIKAGVRYMLNHFNLKHIGFIYVNSIYQKEKHLNTLIESMFENQEYIIDYNIKMIEKRQMHKTLSKSVFSVADYLEEIKNDDNVII